MDVSDILDGLNDAQRQAVTSEARALRVIAGAGSGKTRVLVQRMQWLMAVDGISPYGLLALTFTNKAAREMRQRLEQALARPMGQLWMGTFHGICLRILRRHAPRMGWPAQFESATTRQTTTDHHGVACIASIVLTTWRFHQIKSSKPYQSDFWIGVLGVI